MANLQNADLKAIRSLYDQIDDLMLENKRLKKLAHDLQHEIELKVLQSLETHELEEK